MNAHHLQDLFSFDFLIFDQADFSRSQPRLELETVVGGAFSHIFSHSLMHVEIIRKIYSQSLVMQVNVFGQKLSAVFN